MLDFFVEETENGKLFISYPMVEAIRHILTYESFKDREVPAKVNIKYKTLVPTESKAQLQNMNGYTLEIWSELIQVHLSKMNWIVNDTYGFPEDRIPQQNLLENQLNKFIRPKETVAVVSGFPAFLKEYFGIQKLQEMIPND